MRERSKLCSVCYIAPDVSLPYPSGASVHVTEVASGLTALGHEVHVICRRRRAQDPKEESVGGFVVHRVYRSILWPQGGSESSTNRSDVFTLRSRIYYLYLRTIFAIYVSMVAISIIRRHNTDVILERETSFGAGGIASILAHRPLILEIIGPRYSRLSASRSYKILYYTESMLRDWVDLTKCVQVPAGVNLSLFSDDPAAREEVRNALGITDCSVIGYSGTFQSWHGTDAILSAIKLLYPRHRDIRVLMVGPAPDGYRQLARASGMDEIFIFVGPVPYSQVAKYTNACELMLAPYDPDKDPLRRRYGIGWPLKILEYMACGKAVIASNVPPIDRIVTESQLGLAGGPRRF